MIGVKSTALKFGEQTKPWLNGFAFGMISCLGLAGLLAGETLPFYFSCSLVAFHLFRQIRRVDLNSPDDCWRTFAANKFTGFLIFFSILLGKLWINIVLLFIFAIILFHSGLKILMLYSILMNTFWFFFWKRRRNAWLQSTPRTLLWSFARFDYLINDSI